VPIAHALLSGGIDVMELVLRTPAAEHALASISSYVPSILIGAGTVLSSHQVTRAVAAGARFLVSPGTNPTVVRHAQAAGIPIIPGVATATEIEVALGLGLTHLKFFPAVPMGGAKTLQALSAPYLNVRWMPTGGVSPANMEDFFRLKKQVFAVGGAWLVPRDALAAGDYARVEALAREARQAVKALQQGKR
jgi:2-dehydro-3-deoxyphosphogluconate aldolase/(4S)-4-hydroxy-2-oxoglutarate aldolase